MNVDRGTILVHLLDSGATCLGGHGHRGMVRVERLYHRRNVVDRLPDGGVVAGLEPFHLVADGPEQQRRVVLVAQDGFSRALELLLDLCRVAVVEAVTFMAEPDADRHGHAESLGFVEDPACIIGTPGAHRVGTRSGKALERRAPAGALDEVRLAAPQQLPAVVTLAKFDGHRVGQRTSSGKQEPCTQQGSCRTQSLRKAQHHLVKN